MRTILSHLMGNSCDRPVLAASLITAKPTNAHIEAILVGPDPEGLIRQAAQIDATNALMLSEALEALERESKDRNRDAHASFDAFCKKEALNLSNEPGSRRAVTVSWKDTVGAVTDCLSGEARCHDLLVLAGGPAREGRLSVGEIGQIVLSCGRPVLMTPEREPAAFDTIAVAWKDTPEAAHAVSAALPILKRAKRVEVISTNEDDEGALGCLNCCEGIVRYLRWHEIEAQLRFCVPAGRSVRDAIVEAAKERNCDLLVMGAYGHSRLRELIFGGVTREILSGVDLPVLLCH